MSLLLAVLALLSAHFLLPRAHRALQAKRLLRACRRHRLIALTFDDGPGRQLTPLILERLAAADARATFFVLGREVPQHLDLVAAMRADGHEVGSHGEHHVDHLRTWPWRGVRDTARALDRLEALFGESPDPIAFRPAHGRLNLLSLLHAVVRGAPIAAWTHDGFDTRLCVDVPAAATAASLRRTGGGVLLLHDFDRKIPNPTARVLARVDAVLAMQREGFRFVCFGELRHLLRTGALPARRPKVPMPTPRAATAPASPAPAPDPTPTPARFGRRRRARRRVPHG